MRRGIRNGLMLALVVPAVVCVGCNCFDNGGGNGTQPPSSPILVIVPGGGWRVESGGTLRGATFGGTEMDARFVGQSQLWGKHGTKWDKAGELKIELDDGTVIKAFDSGSSLISWKEGGSPTPTCSANCAYDLPAKWGASGVKQIAASGQDFGTPTVLSQSAQE